MVQNIRMVRKGETFHFASLNGDTWLEVSRAVEDEEADDLRSLIAGVDAAGNKRTLPMTYARRWFDMLAQEPGAETTIEHLT